VDAANLCTAPDISISFGGHWVQTFTVESSGLFDGAEIAIPTATPLPVRLLDAAGNELSSATTSASETTLYGPLSPVLRQFPFADFSSAQRAVHAGDVLRLDVDVPDPVRESMQYSLDTYPGGKLSTPFVGLDREDLCFKTSVLPGP